MEFITTNKNIGIDRYWVNKNETEEFMPSYPDEDIWSYLYRKGYSWEKLNHKVVNFDENHLKTMSITYDKPEDVKDYVAVMLNDTTPIFYYPAVNETQIWNKANELITVQYVMDEWATYFPMKRALSQENINVLHLLKFKNRGKKNPRINANRDNVEVLIIDDTWKPIRDDWDGHSSALYSEWYMKEKHTIKHIFSTYEFARSGRIKLQFTNIRPMDDDDEPHSGASFHDWSFDNTFIINDGETYTKKQHFHDHTGTSSSYDMDGTVEIKMETIDGIQQLTYSVIFDNGEFHTPNKFEPKPRYASIRNEAWVQVWYDDQYVPPPEPEDDETQNNFYVDYQEQPWHNRKLSDENIELLPIEKKVYEHPALYSWQFSKILTEDDQPAYNWDSTTTVTAVNGSTTKEVHILSYLSSTSFNAPKIDYNHESSEQSYGTNITQINVTDDIFNNNGMYTYVVVKPTGMSSLQTGTYTPEKDMNTRNIWYLVPISQMKIQPKTPVLWGQNNAWSTLKQLSTIGTSSAVTTSFSLPIPPTIIGMRSKESIKYVWDVLDENDTTVQETLGNWLGLYDYNYKSDNGTFEHIGVIPITTKTLQMFLENNAFMNKTQEWLNRMNQQIYSLPTTIENEPFLYSPNCFNMGVVAQNDNQTVYLGNDYLNLQYTLNNIGLEVLLLNNATLNYCANRLSETRVISNSRNELAFSVGLSLPIDSSAYTEWLNGNANSESTSWKVYQNNNKLRIIEGVFGSVERGFGSISADPFKTMARALGSIFGTASDIARKTLQDQNEKLQLKARFNNVRASSGTDVSMPSYCASCFAGDKGLVIYTNKIRQDLIDDIGNFRLSNGVPTHMVEPFNYYDNRRHFNVLALNTNYNYNEIRKAIKRSFDSFLTNINDYYIDDFINNYLTGVRLFKGEYGVPYEITDNYENNMWYDR